jgi:type VI secretion system protein ImpJ
VEKVTVVNPFPNHRVVWSEGQLLSPQHFQQQERAIFHQLGAARRHLLPEFHGWSRLRIDLEALQRGLFYVLEAVAVLPDGTVLELPVHSRLPQGLALTPAHAGGVVCLALALDGVGFAQAADESSWSGHVVPPAPDRPVRLMAQEQALADESDPSAEPQHVLLGQLSPRLCLEGDLWAGEIALPVARLRSVSEREGFALDASFVPPLLDLRAHAGLRGELESVVDLIRHRVNWQVDRLNQPQTTAVLETTDFLLLQSLLRHETALRCELSLEPASPLAAFRQLVTLCADLAACSYPPSRVELPLQWRPGEPGQSFAPVLALVRRQLSNMRERMALDITLSPSADGTYLSAQSLPELGQGARIILAVQAQVPNEWLWQRFGDQAIVCASDRLTDRVRLQLAGIALRHLPSAPAELPLQMGWHYFELERSGQAWAELVQSRSLGVHVAGQWPGLSLRGWLLQPRTGQREAA